MAAVPLVRAELGNRAPEETGAEGIDSSYLEDELSAYVMSCFEASRDNRQTNGINDRLLSAMRSMRGEYDPEVSSSIRQFGGSNVYARTTATKVRTLAAALREVFTAAPRPWTITPTPIPELKRSSEDKGLVQEIVTAEVQEVISATGQPPPPALVADRTEKVIQQIAEAKVKQANDMAELRELQIDDVLVEGGFYEALWAFHYDLALFPIACVKGPVVRYERVVRWAEGVPEVKTEAKMFYENPSPFDLYFAPWAKSPQDGYIIHRQSVTQQTLESLIGLPQYDSERIHQVLLSGPESRVNWDTYTETERRYLENRQVTNLTSSQIEQPWSMLEFNGAIPVSVLKSWGFAAKESDIVSSLDVTCWMVNQIVIGVRTNPHPTGKKPFYIASYEKVPGSVYGNALPDILEDVQNVANSCLRALVNNMSMASGPQVIRNEDRFAPNQDGANTLWPWKVWDVVDSMFNNGSSKPLEFFQPESNASELLAVYQAFNTIADEVSSIPRYMAGGTGGQTGALRTASGLSMMMANADRTIKQVVGSIDREVIVPVVEDVHIYLALTRPELSLGGDIAIVAKGSQELLQKETLRLRRTEFLQATANPIDAALLGAEGRTSILREVAKDLGLPIDSIIKPQQAPPGAVDPATGAPVDPTQSGTGAVPPEKPAEQPANPTQGVAG